MVSGCSRGSASRLMVCATLAGCYFERDYEVGTAKGVPIEDVIEFSCGATSAKPGATVSCEAKIPANLGKEKRTIDFETDFGNFVSKDDPQKVQRTAPRNGKVTVSLTSPISGTATVLASIADVTNEAVVTFEALEAATQVTSLSVDQFALEASALSEAQLTVTLAAATGERPAPGQEFVVAFFQDPAFETVYSAGDSRAEGRSDASGTATALITAGETDYRGKIWLQACPMIPEPASEACSSLDILVVDPGDR